MKNLLFSLLAFTLILASCSKTDDLNSNTQSSEKESIFYIDDQEVSVEDFLAVPVDQYDVDESQIEILDGEEDASLRSCCSVGTPFNLSGGTNRFRTKFTQTPGATIRYAVYKGFSQLIGQWEYNFNFNSCTTHYNIVDLDWYCSPAIIPGQQYRFVAVLYDFPNGCGIGKSVYFTGE